MGNYSRLSKSVWSIIRVYDFSCPQVYPPAVGRTFGAAVRATSIGNDNDGGSGAGGGEDPCRRGDGDPREWQAATGDVDLRTRGIPICGNCGRELSGECAFRGKRVAWRGGVGGPGRRAGESGGGAVGQRRVSERAASDRECVDRRKRWEDPVEHGSIKFAAELAGFQQTAAFGRVNDDRHERVGYFYAAVYCER